MRDQYKVLAEKYNLVNKETFGPDINAWKSKWTIDAMLDYTDLKVEDIPQFIEWLDKIYRIELGFSSLPGAEIIDDIFNQLVLVYGQKQGHYGRGWNSMKDYEESMSQIAQSFYSKYKNYLQNKKAAQDLKKGSDKAGVTLDI